MSRSIRLVLAIVMLVPLLACSPAGGPAPAAPSVVAPSSSGQTAQSASGCTAVQFTAAVSEPAEPFPVVFTLSGDLEGTMTVLFAFDTLKYSGPPPAFSGGTLAIEGTAQWAITGGKIAGLASFTTEVKNRNLISDRPGSPANVFENLGTHKETGGVSKANLTYRGTATYGPGLFVLEHHYSGVICR